MAGQYALPERTVRVQVPDYALIGIVRLAVLLFLAGGIAWAEGSAPAEQLRPPEKILAGGEAIDVEIGHAAPHVADLDGDGLPELLVGQFGSGMLRIYRNVGTGVKPRFEKLKR